MHHDDTALSSSALMQQGAKQIAALRGEEAANESHIAEHIRGMVAATMGTLSADASDTTRNNAAHWQRWALSVADGAESPVAG